VFFFFFFCVCFVFFWFLCFFFLVFFLCGFVVVFFVFFVGGGSVFKPLLQLLPEKKLLPAQFRKASQSTQRAILLDVIFPSHPDSSEGRVFDVSSHESS